MPKSTITTLKPTNDFERVVVAARARTDVANFADVIAVDPVAAQSWKALSPQERDDAFVQSKRAAGQHHEAPAGRGGRANGVSRGLRRHL